MTIVGRLVARLIVARALISSLRSRGPDTSAGEVVARPRDRTSVPSRPRDVREPTVDDLPEGPVPSQQRGAPGPDSPLELPAPDWRATIMRTLKEIKGDRVTLVAAGMAYYFFLAIFPGLIAAVGILGLIDVSDAFLDEVTSSISSTLPGSAGLILTTALNNAQSSPEGASFVAAIFGIAVALWSASSGMVALQAGMNIAYDILEDRKFVMKRLVAFALIVVTGVLGAVPSPFFSFGDSAFFDVLGWTATVISLILMFSIFYAIGPKRDSPHWKWVSPGGLVGAFIWLVAAIGLSIYVGGLGNYAKTYGELGGVVVLILWLYLSALAILIGGELNAELERQSALRTATEVQAI
ncbi:MAG: YihY/virulence factor BrkB family protein [Actinobacteria bacterium]|nr:YihY/virulence factor BrkB family protein [Actinomycetota bacterium]